MYNYFAPIPMVVFVKNQLIRLKIPIPQIHITEDVCERVIDIVMHLDYFPSEDEVRWRFNNPQTGLTEQEKKKILLPIYQCIRNEDINIIHVLSWASLIWCWSEEGRFYVKQGYSESARLQRQRFQDNMREASHY